MSGLVSLLADPARLDCCGQRLEAGFRRQVDKGMQHMPGEEVWLVGERRERPPEVGTHAVP